MEDKNIYPKKDGVKQKDKIETIEIDPQADIPVKAILKKLQEKIKLYNNQP